MNAEGRLFADLSALGIAHVVLEHQAVFTVEESSQIDRDMPGAHTKNLFLKDAAGQFWLCTVSAHDRVDLKALPSAIGSKRVSFGKADDMVALLGITPGAVTPLAAMNDAEGKVKIVLAADLAVQDRINIHPLRNTATLGLAFADLIRLLTHWDHAPHIVEIPVLDLV